ncbi:MAG: hypothetical protein WC796_02220 [Candidatus Pacearchaeota archaeon]|jgi:hypothetical protein
MSYASDVDLDQQREEAEEFFREWQEANASRESSRLTVIDESGLECNASDYPEGHIVGCRSGGVQFHYRASVLDGRKYWALSSTLKPEEPRGLN